MKRLYGILLALVLVAVAATPALAQGPTPVHPFRWSDWPLGVADGMAFGFLHSLVTALAVAALGALVVVLLPNQARQVSATAEKSLLPSLGVGCLTVLVALPLFVLLVVLIVTIPAAILLPLALGAAWLFGWIALGWLVGERLLVALQARDAWRVPVITVIVGVLLLALVGAVPVIGWLIGLGAGLVGLGAVILTRFGTRAYPVVTP
jgi:hypothetical protein